MTSPWHTHCPHRVCGTVESAVEVQEVIEQRGIDTMPARAASESLSAMDADLVQRIVELGQIREPVVSRGQLDDLVGEAIHPTMTPSTRYGSSA